MFTITKSGNPSKKYTVIGPYGKIHFGDTGYSDYTIHRDPARKFRYITRHSKREDWTDLSKAGTWSRYILWNKPTLIGSVKDMEKLFNIKIKVL
jgi:hypothetical protein